MLLLVATAAHALEVAHLHVRHRASPHYPREAGGATAVCFARVEIAEDGRPSSVEVRGCTEPFVTSARDALLRWRWAPPRTDSGRSIQARTHVTLKFTPRPEVPIRGAGECSWVLAAAPDGTVAVRSEPAMPCAAWIVERVATPPSEPCTVRFEDAKSEAGPACPEGARSAMGSVLALSTFGPAARTTVTITP